MGKLSTEMHVVSVVLDEEQILPKIIDTRWDRITAWNLQPEFFFLQLFTLITCVYHQFFLDVLYIFSFVFYVLVLVSHINC